MDSLGRPTSQADCTNGTTFYPAPFGGGGNCAWPRDPTTGRTIFPPAIAASYAAVTPGASAPVTFTDALAAAISGPGIGPEPGQCPMDNTGLCNGGSCLSIRECDPYTGANHLEYTLPGGAVPNNNVWTIDPTTGTAVWLGPNGTPATPPSWATPPTAGQSLFNTAQQAKLEALNIGGAHYDPSAGWVLSHNVLPPETQPSFPAYAAANPAGSATGLRQAPGATANANTAAGTGASVGGTNSNPPRFTGTDPGINRAASGNPPPAKTTNVWMWIAIAAVAVVVLKG